MGTSDYLSLSVGELLQRLASREPAPGGGAAAALTVAIAASLMAMAARFSDRETLAEEADELTREASLLAGADSRAYARVLEARRLPRDDYHRPLKLQQALSGAAGVPIRISEIGVRTSELAASLAEDGNPNLHGDALTAALLGATGARTAAHLAEINLGELEDPSPRLYRARELAERADELRLKTEQKAGSKVMNDTISDVKKGESDG